MQGEFRMITDLTVVAPKELLFNYDELKAFLEDALKDYKALVVTEDAIPEAKAKRAKLNKLADNLDSYRIGVKKQLMEQYDTDFAPKVNELKAMAKEASENISTQIKAFEQAEADAKIAEIKAYYDTKDEDLKRHCQWEYVYADKWRNKGISVDMAKGYIDVFFETTASDVATIREMGGEDTAYLLDIYKQGHDLSVVIRKASELKTAKEREEQRRLAAQKAAQDLAHAKQAAQEKREQAAQERLEETAEKAELITVDFRVTCTKTALNALGDYMRRNGIKYGRVPNGD